MDKTKGKVFKMLHDLYSNFDSEMCTQIEKELGLDLSKIDEQDDGIEMFQVFSLAIRSRLRQKSEYFKLKPP